MGPMNAKNIAHLSFNITVKGQMIVLAVYIRILDYTRNNPAAQVAGTDPSR